MDVDKMHSNNVKDADAAKKRSAAAEKDLADYRKKTGVTSESKDEFEPHMMYDPKTGKGYMAKKPADHDRMNKMGYSHDKPKVNEVLDTPKARNSYYDKAKSSKDRATNSAVANILRKGDHSADLKTRAKREKGMGMVKNKAIDALRKEENVTIKLDKLKKMIKK